MRFNRLSIPAFGSFTDFSLKFDKSAADTDLHLVYGSNEAGKSTLLRAIQQMLYGIPARSTDTFLHGGPKMYAGATLSEGDQTLSFLRKKATRTPSLIRNGIASPTTRSTPSSVRLMRTSFKPCSA